MPGGGHDRLGAALQQIVLRGQNALRRPRIDQRSHEGLRRRVPGADGKLRDGGGDGVDHRIAVRARRNDQPPGAGTALARGDVARQHRDARRGLRVLRAPDHQRVVAAHLQRQLHAGAPGEHFVDHGAGVPAAGEQHSVEIGVAQRGRAGLARALDEIEHPGGQPGLLPEPDHELADGRRQLAWLEHQRIARQQGRDDMAVGQMAGEIVRTQHEEDAQRLVVQHLLAELGFGTGAACALVMRLDGDGDLGRHGAGFALGLPERLAGLARDEFADLVLPTFHELAIGLRDRAALFKAGERPVGEGAARGGERLAHVIGGRRRALPDRVARGRIVRDEHLSRTGAPRAGDESRIGHDFSPWSKSGRSHQTSRRACAGLPHRAPRPRRRG